MFGPNFMAIHPRFHSRIKKVKLVVAHENYGDNWDSSSWNHECVNNPDIC